MRRIAVLTSGGDAPGMNAAVVSVARSAAFENMPLMGVNRGYNGVIRRDPALLEALLRRAREVMAGCEEDEKLLAQIEKAVRNQASSAVPDPRPLLRKYRDQLCLFETLEEFIAAYPAFAKDFVNLDLDTVLDIADRPGTHLRTARCDAFRNPANQLLAVLNLTAIGVVGMVVIGGDGSFHGASKLCDFGMPCIGIPGTIDNDLTYTEMTLGYDTAVNVCVAGGAADSRHLAFARPPACGGGSWAAPAAISRCAPPWRRGRKSLSCRRCPGAWRKSPASSSDRSIMAIPAPRWSWRRARMRPWRPLTSTAS